MNDRYLDLRKQGFMKPRRARKPAACPRIVACDRCQNWHPKGQHTRPERPPA